MLTVVEHKERCLVSEMAGDDGWERPAGLFTKANDARNGVFDERWIGDGRELHEPDAVRKPVECFVSQLDGETGLPNSAWAGEREEADLSEEPLELR